MLTLRGPACEPRHQRTPSSPCILLNHAIPGAFARAPLGWDKGKAHIEEEWRRKLTVKSVHKHATLSFLEMNGECSDGATKHVHGIF